MRRKSPVCRLSGFRRLATSLYVPSEVVGNGEIAFAASTLNDVFGYDVQIHTDDGRLLKLKFSEKMLDARANVAHVDVFGDMPAFAQHWHRWERGPSSDNLDERARQSA